MTKFLAIFVKHTILTDVLQLLVAPMTLKIIRMKF